MKFGKRIFTLGFAMFMLMGMYVYSAQAQRGRIIVRRPVVVRPYFSPFRRAYWRYNDPFYADLYKTPYERYQEEKWQAQQELAGNERELREHQEKYNADGFISPKEQKELNDDIRDVERSRARLNQLNGNY